MISVLLHTVDYRGDHAADVVIAYEVLPGETVEALASRLMGHDQYVSPGCEWIEIREVLPARGQEGA